MEKSQLLQYLPILFLLAAAVGFAAGTLTISALLGKFQEGIHSCAINALTTCIEVNPGGFMPQPS